jgi:hypothetical protein
MIRQANAWPPRKEISRGSMRNTMSGGNAAHARTTLQNAITAAAAPNRNVMPDNKPAPFSLATRHWLRETLAGIWRSVCRGGRA